MKPIRLIIEGFMTYKEEQVIDFSSLDLFSIWGETGAGKSTIIDAIIYALFNKIPRLPQTGASDEIIFLGANEAFVQLEFSVGEKEYKVMRTRRRAKPINAYESEDTSVRKTKRITTGKTSHPEAELKDRKNNLLLAEGIEKVNQKIEEILNMDYKTFISTIVLPQGQFDKFLKPEKPEDRRKILTELIGTDIYEKIRKEAAKIRDKAEQEKKEIEILLNQGYKDATPLRIKEIEEKILLYENELKDIENNLINLRNKEKELKEIITIIAELDKVNKSLAELNNEKQSIEEQEDKVKKAREISPIYIEFENKNTELKNKQEELSLNKEKFDLLTKELNSIKNELENAKIENNKIPNLESEKLLLEKLDDKIKRYSELISKIDNIQKAVETNKKELFSAEQHITKVNSEINDLRVKLENNEASKTNLSSIYNKDIHEGFKKADMMVDLYKKTQRKFNKDNNELESLKQSTKEIENNIESLNKKKESIEEKLSSVQNLINEKENELKKANIQHSALGIRKDLKVNDTCPVCLQVIKELPKMEETKPIAELEEKLKLLKTDYDKISTEHKEIEKEIIILENNKKTNYINIEKLESEIEDELKEIKNIASNIGKLIDIAEPSDNDIDSIQEKLREFEKISQELLEIDNCIMNIKDNLQKKEIELIQEKANVEKIETENKKLLSDIEEYESEKTSLNQELSSSLKVNNNFEAVLKNRKIEIDKEIKRIKDNLQKFQEKYNSKDREIAIAENNIKNCNESVKKLENEKLLKENELKDIANSLSIIYDDITELKLYAMSRSEIDKVEKDIREFRNKLSLLEEKRETLKNSLSDRKANENDLKTVQNEIKSSEDSRNKIIEEKGKLKNEKELIEKKIIEAGELRDRLKEPTRKMEIYGRIAKDLEQGKLPNFIVNRVLSELMDIGNIELSNLSNERYRFYLERDEKGNERIKIFDSYEGSSRMVETLSGGESFLASLSLALALSEYLSKKSHLESLFIDEGFGSLDSKTLQEVADTLERLKESGRMIGVISHIEELSERIGEVGQRIIVKKRTPSEGAKIIIEGQEEERIKN